MIFLEIDPNIVKPGWTPLLITIAIAAVMVFGFFSMRRQFRRINVGGEGAADGIVTDGPTRSDGDSSPVDDVGPDGPASDGPDETEPPARGRTPSATSAPPS